MVRDHLLRLSPPLPFLRKTETALRASGTLSDAKVRRSQSLPRTPSASSLAGSAGNGPAPNGKPAATPGDAPDGEALWVLVEEPLRRLRAAMAPSRHDQRLRVGSPGTLTDASQVRQGVAVLLQPLDDLICRLVRSLKEVRVLFHHEGMRIVARWPASMKEEAVRLAQHAADCLRALALGKPGSVEASRELVAASCGSLQPRPPTHTAASGLARREEQEAVTALRSGLQDARACLAEIRSEVQERCRHPPWPRGTPPQAARPSAEKAKSGSSFSSGDLPLELYFLHAGLDVGAPEAPTPAPVHTPAVATVPEAEHFFEPCPPRELPAMRTPAAATTSRPQAPVAPVRVPCVSDTPQSEYFSEARPRREPFAPAPVPVRDPDVVGVPQFEDFPVPTPPKEAPAIPRTPAAEATPPRRRALPPRVAWLERTCGKTAQDVSEASYHARIREDPSASICRVSTESTAYGAAAASAAAATAFAKAPASPAMPAPPVSPARQRRERAASAHTVLASPPHLADAWPPPLPSHDPSPDMADGVIQRSVRLESSPKGPSALHPWELPPRDFLALWRQSRDNVPRPGSASSLRITATLPSPRRE